MALLIAKGNIGKLISMLDRLSSQWLGVSIVRSEELGIDTYYYSKKATAREMCAPLQHQIVTTGVARTEKSERILALSYYGYGLAGGCLGVNCGHFLTPFVVGVNRKPDPPNYLKNVTSEQAEENARVQAQQRVFERKIRKNKERLHIAKTIGDKELIQKYRLKGVNLNATYRAYINEHPFLARHVNVSAIITTLIAMRSRKLG